MRCLLLALCFVAACAPAAPPPRAAAAPAAIAPGPEVEVVTSQPTPPPPPPAANLPSTDPAQVEAAVPPEPGPELPADPYLVPGATRRFARRALVSKGGPIRFSLHGEIVTRSGSVEALYAPIEAIAVEERPRSVRVIVSDEHLRLVLYVPRDVLQRVSTTSAWLSPVAERAPDPAAGVRVAPGIPLTEIEQRGPLRKVSGEVEEIRFEGWVREEAVGEVFVPERFPTPPANGVLVAGTAITSPGGEVLARLPAASTPAAAPVLCCEATLLPGAPAGMQAVRLRRASLEVRGLVPASAAQKKGPGSMGQGSGIGMGSGGFVTDQEHVRLRAGAGVYDRGGARIGTAIDATDMWVGYGARGGKAPLVWATFLFSQFGWLDAQVKPDDLRPYSGR